MRSRGKSLLTSLSPHIQAAFWGDAKKHIEASLNNAGVDCSPRQAQRIAETGRVPGRVRPTLVKILDQAIAAKLRLLERAQNELRAIEYQETSEAHREMVARAADRRAQSDRARAPVAERQDRRK